MFAFGLLSSPLSFFLSAPSRYFSISHELFLHHKSAVLAVKSPLRGWLSAGAISPLKTPEVLPCFPLETLNPFHRVILQREALPEQLFGACFIQARLSQQHSKDKRVCSECFCFTSKIQSIKRDISVAGKIGIRLARKHGELWDERLVSTSMKEHRGVMAGGTPISWSETQTPRSLSSWESINPMVQSDTHHEESRSEQPWDGGSLLKGVGLVMACRGKVLGDCTGLLLVQYHKMRTKYLRNALIGGKNSPEVIAYEPTE